MRFKAALNGSPFSLRFPGVFVSTFDYVLPDAGAEGFYLPVRNDV